MANPIGYIISKVKLVIITYPYESGFAAVIAVTGLWERWHKKKPPLPAPVVIAETIKPTSTSQSNASSSNHTSPSESYVEEDISSDSNGEQPFTAKAPVIVLKKWDWPRIGFFDDRRPFN